MKKVKVTKTEYLEPLFKEGDVVMLKENCLLVVIVGISVNKNRYRYVVHYNHIKEKALFGGFSVSEEELQQKPIDYESVLLEKYLEYRIKYEDLLNGLLRGAKL